jgi:hypothetical protein
MRSPRLLRLPTLSLLAAGLALTLARPASAQFELAWDSCPGSYSAHTNKTFDCSSDAAVPLKLVLAFTPPQPLDRFVGVAFLMDITTSSAELPDWWGLGANECREGALTFPAPVIGASGTCVNPWMGAQGTTGGYLWTSRDHGPNHASLLVVFVRDTRVSLSSGQRYVGGVMTIDTQHTTGADGPACAGCSGEACITVTEVRFNQEAGPNTPDEIVYNRSMQPSVATFNVADPGNNPCGAKVTNKSWSEIKAKYRSR